MVTSEQLKRLGGYFDFTVGAGTDRIPTKKADLKELELNMQQGVYWKAEWGKVAVGVTETQGFHGHMGIGVGGAVEFFLGPRPK